MARFDAVIFDMDGTLIEQRLDFVAIRAELGIAGEDGILETIQRMPAADRRIAEQRLLEFELAAAEHATLLPGATEVLARVAAAGLKTALLTRNAREVMESVIVRFDLRFDLAWSRENGPIKPEPDGILRACDELGVTPQRTCCVGDFYYDIAAANAAGATSVLLDPAGQATFAHEADFVIAELDELTGILEI